MGKKKEKESEEVKEKSPSGLVVCDHFGKGVICDTCPHGRGHKAMKWESKDGEKCCTVSGDCFLKEGKNTIVVPGVKCVKVKE